MIYFLYTMSIIQFIVFSYLSVKNNDLNNTYYWGILVWFIGAIPVWPFITRYSENIFKDSVIFNTIVISTITLSILYFSYNNIVLSKYNIIGFCMILLGLILIQLKP